MKKRRKSARKKGLRPTRYEIRNRTSEAQRNGFNEGKVVARLDSTRLDIEPESIVEVHVKSREKKFLETKKSEKR